VTRNTDGRKQHSPTPRLSPVRDVLRLSDVHARPICPHTEAAGDKERRDGVPLSSSKQTPMRDCSVLCHGPDEMTRAGGRERKTEPSVAPGQ
jgi:hypothetical protein